MPPRKTSSTLAAAAACAALLLSAAAGPAPAKPNIVLIMADDMGYECLSANGSAEYQTPHLDKLAAEGLRFTHCYSTPLCTPSRVQIMTGKYNFRNYDEFGYLDPKEKTFGNLLRGAGYKTCIAGKWQLNGLSYPQKYPEELRTDGQRPEKAGFDEWCLWQLTRSRSDGERYADPAIERNGKFLGKIENAYGPEIFCDFIIDFIDRHQEKPFFVYYPMVLTHDPFVPTPDTPEWEDPKLRMKQDKRFFADMVAYADKNVGRIVTKLEALGLMENTVVLFTGDNGTHPSITTRMQDGGEIRGDKGRTPDAGTHVALVANWRGKSPGKVCDDLVDFTDFYPTLADAAEIDISKEENLDGRSFLPQIRGEEGNPRDFVFCHYDPRWGKFRDESTRFARDQQYKLYMDGRFYDVPADMLEKHDIDPETAEGKEAKAKLQAVLDSMPPFEEREPTPLGPAKAKE